MRDTHSFFFALLSFSFTRDPGMEQIYRDARISTIYEGTTGVQALDLLGRKVLLNKGKYLRHFTRDILKYSYDAGLKVRMLHCLRSGWK